MKLISIIIPHYNNWGMLTELIETIPNNETFEIIVIDDHSDNASYNIKRIKKNFTNIIFEKNDISRKGAGAARNKGLRLATGKWILFADSDDLFTLNFDKIVKPYLDTSFDIVYFSPTSFIDGSSKSSGWHNQLVGYVNNYLTDKTSVNESILKYYYVVPWSKLIKHSLIKDNSIEFEEIMVANDILFSAKIGYYSNQITASSKNIYNARERNGSLTNVISEKLFKQRIDAWVDYIIFLKKNLSKQEINSLNITAMPALLNVVKDRLGVNSFLYVIKRSVNNKISLFDRRLFNPFFLIKSFNKYNKIFSKNIKRKKNKKM